MKVNKIHLTTHEIQSGLNRVQDAEGLILQLPKNHDGRNTWLLNYGVRKEAQELRNSRCDRIERKGYRRPPKLVWSERTCSLKPVS